METIVGETAPTATNPLGVKGAGEGGVPGIAAAVATAIEQALGRPGLVTAVPILPENLIVREFEDDYAEAFQEWIDGGEAEVWETVVGDGLIPE